MKILAKIKKRPYILSILFALLLISIVYAAEYYQVNSGAQATINEWSVCKKVTNNNALAIFVPTKTEAEWTAFRTNASGVTYAECCSANGVACSSDASCCSAKCGTNADGDAYFSLAAGHTGTCQATSKPYTDCCDSDNRAYPGETTYYSTINNCSSWDYNCSGTVTKHSYYCDKVTSCTVDPSCGSVQCGAYTCWIIISGGTGSYYACGATATNACKYGWLLISSCSCTQMYFPGIRTFTLNSTTSRICTTPVPASDSTNPKCECL